MVYQLLKACEKASLSLFSDSVSDLHISLKVNVSGHGNQAPRRGGCQPRRQEVEPGTLAPSPASPPAATPPAPVRRARGRGPAALLRDERRRLARIEPTLLQDFLDEVEGDVSALPPSALTTPAIALARRDERGQVKVATPGPAAAAAVAASPLPSPCGGTTASGQATASPPPSSPTPTSPPLTCPPPSFPPLHQATLSPPVNVPLPPTSEILPPVRAPNSPKDPAVTAPLPSPVWITSWLLPPSSLWHPSAGLDGSAPELNQTWTWISAAKKSARFAINLLSLG